MKFHKAASDHKILGLQRHKSDTLVRFIFRRFITDRLEGHVDKKAKCCNPILHFFSKMLDSDEMIHSASSVYVYLFISSKKLMGMDETRQAKMESRDFIWKPQRNRRASILISHKLGLEF
jgi:hypothetical protein